MLSLVRTDLTYGSSWFQMLLEYGYISSASLEWDEKEKQNYINIWLKVCASHPHAHVFQSG